MDVYETLRGILDAHPSGAPHSAVFDKIIRILFTPDEAALATHMSFMPRSAEAIASDAGIVVDEACALLEAMADKAIIFCRDKEGQKSYGLLPTIPGLFEFPFMKGGGTPMHDRLAGLWKEYHDTELGASFAGNPTPVARIIPVEQSLTAATQVHPYEEVALRIDEVDYIALGTCACRVTAKACDAPLDVCLIFDGAGKFLVERGYARRIDRTEAHRVLDRAEEAGLVHTSSNSADKATFICNCCKCCCTILTLQTQLNIPHAFATSAFQARVDSTECTGCGICVDERCPMGAIAIEDDVAEVITEKCIGCGLCVTGCPVDAIILERRSTEPPVPDTMKDMTISALKEKGKLARFMEVMKK
jgi:electron transport complex protein RnfB